MAKKNIYVAVFESGETKTFYNWPECQKAVSGKSNVHFKGFVNMKEANHWLKAFKPSSQKINNSIEIYVDGSFSPDCKRAGWGWVAAQNEEKLAEKWGVTERPALSRNIDGELVAAVEAIKWAKEKGHKATIFHDYAGIHEWARGTWKAKSEIAKYYCEALFKLGYPVDFKKVTGHSGNKWNDLADSLAKKGIEEFLQINQIKSQ